MKEELIKELVANSKFTNRINLQYQHKIESLQREAHQHSELIEQLQQQIGQSGNNGTHKVDFTKNEMYIFESNSSG